MAMTITPHDESEFETVGRRRKITKFALAGVAVLGVGAALTSAAWSDNVWFAGDASTGTLDLSGSADGGASWEQGTTEGTAIQIPSSIFANIGPNIAVTHALKVRNDGSLDVQLSTPLLNDAIGNLFDGDGTASFPNGKVADIAFSGWDQSVISTNEVATFEVTVTGGSWVGSEFQGATGSLVIQVQGETIATP